MTKRFLFDLKFGLTNTGISADCTHVLVEKVELESRSIQAIINMSHSLDIPNVSMKTALSGISVAQIN